MKRFISLICIFSFLFIATGCQTNGEDSIKLGVVAPLSGGPSLWGQGSLNMIEMAANEINETGGINGKKIEVIAEDGKCQSEGAITAVNKLINLDGVKFVMGGHCSPETAAIAPVLNENKVFGLAGVSTATGILSDYEYVFRTSPPNLDQAGLIAKLAKDKYGYKNIATLTEQTAFAQSITNDFITSFTGSEGLIAIQEEFVSGQTDFKTELTKINSLNPDAIFISPQSPVAAVQIIKQINELGIETNMLGNTVLVSTKVYTDSDNLLPSNTFSVGPYVDKNISKTEDLISKYKTTYEEDVPYNLFFVGAAYDGVYMLKDALMECGEDTECVKDYFANIENWQGNVANYSFSNSGDSEIDNWRELRIVDGQEVFETI